MWTAQPHPQCPAVALPLPGGVPGLGLPIGRQELTRACVSLSRAQSPGHGLNRGGAPGGRVREWGRVGSTEGRDTSRAHGEKSHGAQ